MVSPIRRRLSSAHGQGPAAGCPWLPLERVVYRLVVCQGQILDTPRVQTVPMPYFLVEARHRHQAIHGRLDPGGRHHHQALVLGRHLRRWKMLCEILRVDCVTV